MDTGNLAAAENALREIADRREESREQLAFDPALRRRWFADNLAVYRKLLWIAAQRNDSELALNSAERLRARALLDELNWRKVDIGPHLAGPIQERLEALRVARRETYALLQQAIGCGASADVIRGLYLPIRGTYLPIRGAYLPIRGTEPSDGTAVSADLVELRQRLEALSREEAALEAAVREMVPSFAQAAQQQVLDAQELSQRVAQMPDLAVLEYTLCEDGLVVIALRAGQSPQLAHIAIPPDELLSRLEGFRTASKGGVMRSMLWQASCIPFLSRPWNRLSRVPLDCGSSPRERCN